MVLRGKTTNQRFPMKFPAQSILLIATRHIGDVLLTTPLLRSLRLAYPTARIDAIVYNWTAGILDGNPDLNHVITVNQDPPFSEYAALVKRIFRRYDLAVSTLTSDRPILHAFWAAGKRVSCAVAHTNVPGTQPAPQ